ncbi:MAG TPA: glycosyltransferase [Candidatus Sulfotelmatobacter sp.]|nr:glycosyltransferase [Candidatus Sulfotelmatobacter sp.]
MSSYISFIIAVRDEPNDMLQATLEGLLRTSDGYQREIVLVDDCSIVPLQIELPDILVVRNAEPIGSARSRRTGASFASGDVLSFLDPHMSFAPDWLDKMMAHVDSGELLCSAWWDYELTRCHCWGADFRWCGDRDYVSGRCPGFDFLHRTVFPGDGAVEVPMLIGANYMMLRSSYERVGGFSPFFRTWGRLEQDLCLRAWIVGVGVKCVTDARVGHFSRKKFPYKVSWEDIEFNQLATVRTAFEASTSRQLERLMQPPPQVKNWLAETDYNSWRESIQSRRVITDRELFERLVPDLPNWLVN